MQSWNVSTVLNFNKERGLTPSFTLEYSKIGESHLRRVRVTVPTDRDFHLVLPAGQVGRAFCDELQQQQWRQQQEEQQRRIQQLQEELKKEREDRHWTVDYHHRLHMCAAINIHRLEEYVDDVRATHPNLPPPPVLESFDDYDLPRPTTLLQSPRSPSPERRPQGNYRPRLPSPATLNRPLPADSPVFENVLPASQPPPPPATLSSSPAAYWMPSSGLPEPQEPMLPIPPRAPSPPPSPPREIVARVVAEVPAIRSPSPDTALMKLAAAAAAVSAAAGPSLSTPSPPPPPERRLTAEAAAVPLNVAIAELENYEENAQVLTNLHYKKRVIEKLRKKYINFIRNRKKNPHVTRSVTKKLKYD